VEALLWECRYLRSSFSGCEWAYVRNKSGTEDAAMIIEGEGTLSTFWRDGGHSSDVPSVKYDRCSERSDPVAKARSEMVEQLW